MRRNTDRYKHKMITKKKEYKPTTFAHNYMNQLFIRTWELKNIKDLTATSVSGDRITDAMSSRRKNQEQQTANNSNTHRNNIQNLLGSLLRRRIKTAHSISLPQSHRTKHKHRQNCVDPVDDPDPVFTKIGQTQTGGVRVVKNPHTFTSRKPVVHVTVFSLDAVRERAEEA